MNDWQLLKLSNVTKLSRRFIITPRPHEALSEI